MPTADDPWNRRLEAQMGAQPAAPGPTAPGPTAEEQLLWSSSFGGVLRRGLEARAALEASALTAVTGPSDRALADRALVDRALADRALADAFCVRLQPQRATRAKNT